MDLSMIEDYIPDLAAWLNVEPATVLLLLGIVCTTANLIGRQIPDDKAGLVGFIRDVCKLIGLYAPNRSVSRDASLEPPAVTPAFPGLKRNNEEINHE